MGIDRSKKLAAVFSTARLYKFAVFLNAFFLAVSLSVVATQTGQANPTGGRVTAGSASISGGAGRLDVHQNSDKVIINWDDFSIDTGEVTQFHQPNAGAAALNRVVSGNPSQLLGTLNANGKIYLINPNGIIVGAGGVINTQSFIASTLNISDQSFLEGGDIHFSGDSSAAVVNLGHIEAAGGYVYLIAREVSNEGTIQAAQGHVGLAAGREVLLLTAGDERIQIQVPLSGANVSNAGAIAAAQVELKAVGNNPMALAINNSGVIRATGFRREGGKIILTADRGRTVSSGEIRNPGGRIDILGDHVRVDGVVDVSSVAGGGEINIGGDYQGQGNLKLARTTEVSRSAVLRADGQGNSDGGDIIVWSEEHTLVDGTVTARGGNSGGDGGFVETSSRGLLEFNTSVDVSAPAGRPGEWLLDPEDITIGTGQADNISNTLNQGGDVSIKTAPGGSGQGNINVNAPISKTEGGDASLSLTAHHDVNVNAPITSTSGALNVNLTGGHAVNVNAAVQTNGGGFSTVVTGLSPSEPESNSQADTNSDANTDTNTDTGTQTDTDTNAETPAGSDETPPAEALAQENPGSSGTPSSGTPPPPEPAVPSVAETPAANGTQAPQLPADPAPAAPGSSPSPAADAGLILIAADVTTGGGNIYLDAGGSPGSQAIVDASLDAGGDQSRGADITVLGDRISLTSNARLNASGGQQGGRIQIGGAFQGNDSLPASTQTSVAAGATLRANATDAHAVHSQGGEVIVWSDGSTDFAGHIEARAANPSAANTNKGGFAEVSGREYLQFTGTVDTGGGTLLLDPNNILIGDGGLAPPGFSVIAPGTISTALTANDVIIHTSGTDSEPGDVRIDSDLLYDSVNNFSILAHRHIEAFANIQNVNDSSGDINLLAGWDGVTGFAATDNALQENGVLDIAAIEANATSYGNNGGSVFIGDGGQTEGVAVGSRSGTTRVYAHDLNLTAGGANIPDFDGSPNSFAQLGYKVSDQGGGHTVTGDINVRVNNDIVAQGGGNTFNYVQIGHVGADLVDDVITEASVDSDITISAGNNISFIAGDGATAYAQLGHGGRATLGDHSGDIIIEQGNDLTFEAGGGVAGAYAQLGHGGFLSNGDQSGAITIEQVENINFTAGDNLAAYAQFGHGGFLTNGDYFGAITIGEAGNIVFRGGNGDDTYAQLGHGGSGSDGDHSGDITIGEAGDIAFETGTGFNTYAQLGHGGRNTFGDYSGGIAIGQAGDLDFTAGNGVDAYAQLGHGGFQTNGDYSGAITIDEAGDITFSGGDGSGSHAQLGHGGSDADGDHSGNIAIGQAGDLDFAAGSGVNAYVQFGHGGSNADGNHSGDITIEQAENITFTGGSFTIGGPVSANNAYAQLGHGGDNANGSHSGDITIGQAGVITMGTTDIPRVTGFDAYVQLGHGGRDADGNHSGAITIEQAGNLDFNAGTWDRAYAQLGHGGFDADGNHSGAITIGQVNNIEFRGGELDQTYAQLGHGGFDADGSHSGDITIVEANDLDFTAGDRFSAYAHLGHGGFEADGNHSGAITIQQANDIEFNARSDMDTRTEFDTYAQLGHGGGNSNGNQSGDITIDRANNLKFIAGDGDQSYSQLGHGGHGANSTVSGGDLSGAISINQANNIAFIGGTDTDTYAQLGHGGRSLQGNASGDITVNALGNLLLKDGAEDPTDGTAVRTDAFIGHGGVFTQGTRMGNISLKIAGESSLVHFDSGEIGIDKHIGHVTDTADNISNADIIFQTGALDDSDTAAATATTVDAFFAANDIIDNLRSGDFTLVALGLAGDDGELVVDAPIDYDSVNDLNLFSTRDVNFNASVQNRHDPDASAGGAINVVAGLDDADFDANGFDAARYNGFDVAAADPKPFANNGGNVNIGDGGQTDAIAVGSRSGDTRVYANDLNITAGDFNDDLFAQLGYQVTNAGADHNVTGDITVHVMNDINARGADIDGGGDNYAQIGHVGADPNNNENVDASVNSDIEIAAGNNINFIAGFAIRSYAQLGHGGFGSYSEEGFAGDINVLQANDLNFEGAGGGGFRSYSQLGHGGNDTDGNHSGDITIQQANDLNFEAGADRETYARLGHGGVSADGDLSGAITIGQANNILFAAGNNAGRNDDGAYAQLGHGGTDVNGNHSGAITIGQVNDIQFVAGNNPGGIVNDNGAYAQLGHGGFDADGDHSGAIVIEQAENIDFTADGGENAYAQLGHGGFDADGNHAGDITVMRANDINLAGGAGDSAYTQLGHGGADADGNHSGDITVMQANEIDLAGGSGDNAYAQLGHGGVSADGERSGNIDITHNGNLLLTGQERFDQYAIIGHGDEPLEDDTGETVSGDVMIRTGGNATLENAFIGHITETGINYQSGNTFIGVGGDLIADSFSRFNSAPTGELRLYVGTPANDQVDSRALLNGSLHGGNQAPNNQGQFAFGEGPYDPAAGTNPVPLSNFAYYTLPEIFNYRVGVGEAANIIAALESGTEVTLERLLPQFDFGALYDVDGGTQFIDIESAVIYNSIADFNLFATGDVMLGASVQNQSDNGGAINIVAGLDGDDFDANGFDADRYDGFDLAGADPKPFANNNGTVTIGDGSQAAGIAVGSRSGGTRVYANDLNIIAGAGGDGRFAQLGYQATDQGDAHNVTGDISVQVMNDITLSGGADGQFNYAQIGHVGADPANGMETEANVNSNIEIAAGNNINFIAGDGNAAYVQLGHGGSDTDGDYSGDITIGQANDIHFEGGTGEGAYAQLGHGGVGTQGNHSGNISITHDGNLVLVGQDVLNRYALLGHGDEPGDDDAGNMVSGDVMLRTGGTASLENAFIGHLIDVDGQYTTGNTFIGVGGDLITDEFSQLNSADTGELRIYLASVANDQVHADALLNGDPHGSVAAPNDQGAAEFGAGPYNPGAGTNPTAGNFNYYVGSVPMVDPPIDPDPPVEPDSPAPPAPDPVVMVPPATEPTPPSAGGGIPSAEFELKPFTDFLGDEPDPGSGGEVKVAGVGGPGSDADTGTTGDATGTGAGSETGTQHTANSTDEGAAGEISGADDEDVASSNGLISAECYDLYPDALLVVSSYGEDCGEPDEG